MAKRQSKGGKGAGGRSSRGGGRQRSASTKHYPRTARLNALLTEIIADHFERVDHDDLGFVTITGVEVDADLNVCQVFVSTLAEPDPIEDDLVLDALASERRSVQRAIATQAKLRKTPDVVFAFDPAVRAGARIDSILATLDLPSDEPAADEPAADEPAAVDPGAAGADDVIAGSDEVD